MRSFIRTQNVFHVCDLPGFDAFLARHRCKRLKGDGELVGFQQRQDDTYYPEHVRPEEHFGPLLTELATFLAVGEIAIVCHVSYAVEFTSIPGWIMATLIVVKQTGTIQSYALESLLQQLPSVDSAPFAPTG